MNRYDNEVSNLSYTNKDFNSIYNELLDLADRISPKWKPSQSNESDPGALLIKLDALVGDKNNYNIDKNILEVFPSSVTQYPNAREVFEQCGYIMPYYRAADVVVSINMTSEPEGAIEDAYEVKEGALQHKDTTRLYTLPDFTMLTNEDNSIVYTIVDQYPFLTSDRKTYDYKALQGSIKDYTLNNSLLITYNSLDYNNRLYFKEPNIAENGIFITNVVQQAETKNYSDWKKVDNILTEAPNTLCYKFGVSKDGSKCYIEFPTDIANLIGEGIHIKYITTSGYSGNISDKVLTSFFGDINSNVTNATITLSTPKNRDTDKDRIPLTITNDNVYIRNVKASSNGRDPETISEARINYERTKNTFETLVSLRDYNNFLLNSDQVSNGFICDRSNDVQASTRIVTTDGELESIYTQVRASSSVPELSAFDLRIYALKYVDPVTTETRFDLTFDLADSYYLKNVEDDMADIKCIQHDFKPLNEKEIIMIQLKYPIYAKIIPYNRLETLQQLEIQSNIRKALFESLNSGKLSFGEEIDYDSVYDTIMESDNRIKSLILDDFDYTAHIIYRDGTNIASYEIPSSTEELEGNLDSADDVGEQARLHYKWLNTIKAKAILAGVTSLLEKPDFNFNYSYLHTHSSIYENAGKVNTVCELTLPVKDNKASIKLKENESIYLTTNNYITKETYTNYVKYFYRLNNDVQPNELYELSEKYKDPNTENNKKDSVTYTDPEYIAFFWKENDEDEHYYYTKFKKGSEDPDTNLRIISPSFRVNAGSTEGNFSLKDGGLTAEIYEAAQRMVDALPYSSIQEKVPENTFDIIVNGKTETYTESQLIAKCDTGTILSNSKSIQIKDKNTILFDPNDKPRLYWLRNNSETDPINNESVYYLFEDAPVNGILSYTLKTGEYLFYSDKDGKTFSMLGPGTKLECGDPSLRGISVKARTYEEILYGANNLLNDEGLWKIPTAKITAYEMMFYNIGAESIVTFTLNEPIALTQYTSDVMYFYNFKNSVTTNTIHKLVEDDEDDEYIVFFIQESQGYKYIKYGPDTSIYCNFNIDQGKTSENISTEDLSPYQEVEDNIIPYLETGSLKVLDENLTEEIEACAPHTRLSENCINIIDPDQNIHIDKNIILGQHQDLSNCSISYTYQDSTIELPKLSITDAKWSGRSYLNLNCGPSNEQILYNQADVDGNTRKHSIVITKTLDKSSGNNYTFKDTVTSGDYSNFTIPKPSEDIPPELIIQSNYNIEILGGEDIDVTAFDLNAVRYNNAFYCYKKSNDTGSNFETTNDYVTEIELTYNGTSGITSFDLSYPPESLFGENDTIAYLLPIVTLKDYESVTLYKDITLNPTTIFSFDYDKKYYIESDILLYKDSGFKEPINGTADKIINSFVIKGISILYARENKAIKTAELSANNELSTLNTAPLAAQGIKFFAFIKDTSNLINPPSKLIITVENKSIDKSDASKIRVLPIVPYLNEAEIKLTVTPTETEQSKVQLHEILKSLDSEHKFNYIHEVKSDVLIENPWDPYSFLDKNHPYNHATICRWDYDDSTIKITNKIK